MQMTDSEIVRRYKHAIDKKSMIGILADLNACDKTKIREILTAAGLNVGKLNGPGRPKKTPEQALKIETPEKEVIPFYVSGKEDEPSAEVTEEAETETKEAAGLPDIAIEAMTEKYHGLLKMKERFLEIISDLETQIGQLEPYVKGGK